MNKLEIRVLRHLKIMNRFCIENNGSVTYKLIKKIMDLHYRNEKHILSLSNGRKTVRIEQIL